MAGDWDGDVDRRRPLLRSCATSTTTSPPAS
jgi:hypothetical protein